MFEKITSLRQWEPYLVCNPGQGLGYEASTFILQFIFFEGGFYETD